MRAPEALNRLLHDGDVTDVCLNGHEELYADRGQGLKRVSLAGWDAEGLRSWLLEQLSSAGRAWDARHPFVDASLMSGHRLHAAFPPVSGGRILVSLRRLPGAGGRVPNRWSQAAGFEPLARAVERGETVLISGATGSGKTTLACELLARVPAEQRIIALEDTPELAPEHPHFVSLLSRAANADGCGEVSLRALLKQTLRMRPDRVILGECRGAEVLELLQALNTGHQGAMATLHANSPRDALRRIELLCLLAAGGALPAPALRELLATGVQWIAQVARVGDARVISQLCRVEGREGDAILLRSMLGPGFPGTD
jgi:pilus assembly protein CpaF